MFSFFSPGFHFGIPVSDGSTSSPSHTLYTQLNRLAHSSAVNMRSIALLLVLAAVCNAFKASVRPASSFALMARSKAVPFLDQPAALDGSMPGDVGMHI